MNILIAKEVRLLAPAFWAALALAALPVWLFPQDFYNSPAAGASYAFWLGTALLGLASFGREFAGRTFGLLISQPIGRGKIWTAKLGVLAGAALLVCVVWAVSCNLRGEMLVGPKRLGEIVVAAIVIGISIMSSGLWTTLLLRQVAGAFWFSLLVPLALLVATNGLRGNEIIQFVVLGLYSTAGLIFAYRQFVAATDSGWTGGEISLLSSGRLGKGQACLRREWGPTGALWRKEWQLHQFTLAGIAGLALLHLGIVIARKAGGHELEASAPVLVGALQVFGGVWLIAPVLAAAESVAEERKLGTIQELLCLPVRNRRQLAVKFLTVVLIGAVLCSVLLWSIEGLAVVWGADNRAPMFREPFAPNTLLEIMGAFLLFSFVAFYASTLARSLIQAMAIALVLLAGLMVVNQFVFDFPNVTRIWLWRGQLIYYVAWPVLVCCTGWLIVRNHRVLIERKGFWKTNCYALAGSLVLVLFITIALYHRAWDFLRPVEPPHGPALFQSAAAPRLRTNGRTLTSLLPDGRVRAQDIWYQPGLTIGSEYGHEIHLRAQWTKFEGSELAGTNWADALASFRETVAIQTDGSLWVSPKPNNKWMPKEARGVDPSVTLKRAGAESDWKHVIGFNGYNVILQKNDGGLWFWGDDTYTSKTNWPGLSTLPTKRLVEGTNWTRAVFSASYSLFAWDEKDRAWYLTANGRDEGSNSRGLWRKERMSVLDGAPFISIADHGMTRVAVRADGTLCTWHTLWSLSNQKNVRRHGKTTDWDFPETAKQVGAETNWILVASEQGSVIALKTDGTLWRWREDEALNFNRLWLAGTTPERVGKYSDWLAIADGWEGVFALAADGNLRFWWYPLIGRGNVCQKQPLLDAPRRPDLVENAASGRML